MRKSEFDALITDKWGDITSPKRTPAEDRDVAGALRDEIWSLEATDTESTSVNVVKEPADAFAYSIVLKKTGNGTWFKINFRNKTSAAVSPQYILTWKSGTPFKPKTSVNGAVVQCWNGSNRVGVRVDPSGLYLTNSLSPSTSLYGSTFEFYIAEN